MTVAITVQPTAQVVTQGDPATFSLTATGTAPLEYLWYEATAGLILGEATNTLVVEGDLLNDGNSYYCVVTDVDGSLQSSTAGLTVNPASTIAPVVTGPDDVTANVGQPAVFSVTAYGAGPFTYQWRVAFGAFIPGATDHTVEVLAWTSVNGAKFECIVTDVSGLVTTSRAGVLTVVDETIPGSATIEYPCALPGVLVNSNGYQPKDRVRHNELSSGPPLFILEDDDGYELFDVSWSFSAYEVQAFRNWYRHVTVSGSKLFNIELWVDGFDGFKQTKTHECYFVGVPQYIQQGRRWRVSATLLAIDEKILGYCDGQSLVEAVNVFGGFIPEVLGIFDDIFTPEPPETPVEIPPECVPYACDAIKANNEVRAEASWYGEGIYYDGLNVNYPYRVPSDQGGTALQSAHGNLDWLPSPIIPNACYSSLRINSIGGGPQGVLDATAGERTGGSMLALLTDVAAGDYRSLIDITWYYDIYISDVYQLAVSFVASLHIHSNQLRGSARVSGGEIADIAALPPGINLLTDPLIAVASFSCSLAGQTATATVTGSINFKDGSSAQVTATDVNSVGAPGAELRFTHADMVYAGGGARGYYNNFKKGTDLDLTSFYRNFDDYTPPGYCEVYE